MLGRRHRQRARVEDRIRDDKDAGLAKLPFKEFALNEVWLEIVMLAHDLIVWTQALLLNGKAEPKRLRYRLLHVTARLAFHRRRDKLRLQHDWPHGHASSPPPSRSSKHSRRHRLTPLRQAATPPTRPPATPSAPASKPPKQALPRFRETLNSPSPRTSNRHDRNP